MCAQQGAAGVEAVNELLHLQFQAAQPGDLVAVGALLREAQVLVYSLMPFDQAEQAQVHMYVSSSWTVGHRRIRALGARCAGPIASDHPMRSDITRFISPEGPGPR